MLQPYDVDDGLKSVKTTTSAIIGLGSNLASDQGGSGEILQMALKVLAGDRLEIKARSRFYTTPCYPVGSGPDYVNAAALITTDLPAIELLGCLHSVEQSMGRERVLRWGARTLDLDLLAFGDEIAPDLQGYSYWKNLPPEAQVREAPERLILPHPRLQDRAFVLVPMNEIAPDWRHPVTGRSTRQMLADLDPDEIAQILPL